MAKESSSGPIIAIISIVIVVLFVSGGFTGLVTDPNALEVTEYIEWRSKYIFDEIEPPTLYEKTETVGPSEYNQCTDTDGGINIAVKGAVTIFRPGDGLVTYPDSCVVSSDAMTGEGRLGGLREYYCVQIGTYNRMFSKFVHCDGECIDGACI